MTVERISAVTLRVASMQNSVRFYRDVLGMELIYGGEDGCFLVVACGGCECGDS
jgi:catechol 2,3-dioxygenase-like lactoylglutathione lyase family enzyme